MNSLKIDMLVLLLFAWVIPISAKTETKDEKTNCAAYIAAELERCPDWTYVPPTDLEARKAITGIYLKLAHLDTGDIRDGVRLFLSRYEPPKMEAFAAGDKVFPLLRVVFKVPSEPVDARKDYCVMGNPWKAGFVDLLWPYSLGKNGELVLSGIDIGMYSGPPYDGMADFDRLEKDFGRRFITQKSHKNTQ